jgi:hypothetical protein
MNVSRKCGICTQLEFYLAMKKNKILSFAGKWMETENILSEVSQAQKTKVPHMWTLDLGQMQQCYWT